MAILFCLLSFLIAITNSSKNGSDAIGCKINANPSYKEVHALKALNKSTNGEYWINKWHLLLPSCSWKGVCCRTNPLNSNVINVISLDLSDNNLTGSISNSISNLTYLQSIDFQNNFLIGEIPSNISSLQHLSYINLGNNMFSGGITAINCNGTNFQQNLTILVLSRNNLTGNNSLELLTHCKRLQLLYVANNSFGGTIPNNISLIADLQYLDLSTNAYIGSIPAAVMSLTALQLLSLSNMSLLGNIGFLLQPLIHLEYLSIYNSPNIYGKLNQFVCNATNMTVLQIAQTNIDGYIPNCVVNLKRLTVLDLSRNAIQGTLPNIFKRKNGMNNLTTLNIGRNNMHGTIPDSYCSHRIQAFIIDHNNFTSLPECFYVNYKLDPNILPPFHNLSYLDVSDNKISSSKQLNLTMQNLTYAFLHKNEFTGSLPLFRNTRQCLEKVTVHDNNFNDKKISTWLAELFDPNSSPNVTVVSVYNNSKLKGEIPAIYSNSSIQALFAHRCDFNKILSTPNINNYTGPNNLINITLYYNSLSCNVPQNYLSTQLLESRRNQSKNETIIVVSGNRFQSNEKNIFKLWFNDGDTSLPKWVDSMESDSTALYITAVDMFQQYLVFVVTVIALSVLIIRHCGNEIQRKRGRNVFMSALLQEQKLFNIDNSTAINVNNQNNNVNSINQELHIQLQHPFFAKLSTVAFVLGSKTAIFYVIIMAILYRLSSTLYKCGNYLAHWSIAYFESTHINFLMILLMAIIYNIAITYLFYYLYFRFQQIDDESISSPRRVPSDSTQFSDISPRQQKTYQKYIRCRQILSKLYSLMLILLWLLTLFCVFIYFLFATLPNNNNLGISPSWLPLSHYSMAAILSFNNIFIVPSVADTIKSILIKIYVCCCCGKNDAQEVSTLDYKVRSITIIVLRSVTNIFLPIVFSLLLLNECGGYWILFWQGCYPSIGKYSPQPYFNVSSTTEYYNKFRIKYAFDNYTYPSKIKTDQLPSIHHSINREIEILSSKDICSYGFGTNLESGEYCMRDFFEYWGTTILLKFFYNLFMPFLMMFRYWIVFKYCGCKHGYWKFAKKHFRPDSSYASIISYLEIVIIFGFVIPCLIPLCAVAFLINFWVYTKW